MDVTCIADTHNFHRLCSLPGGDLLIFAGDCMPFHRNHDENSFIDFVNWISEQKYAKKVFVPGNHDAILTLPWAQERLRTSGAHVLIDSGVEIGGMTLWGSPWVPKRGNGAFMLPSDGSLLKNKWEAVPEGVLILITHVPPQETLDFVHRGVHIGCKLLKKELIRINPAWHIFGHCHEGHGLLKNTRINVNCSFLDCKMSEITDDNVREHLNPVVSLQVDNWSLE